MRHQAFDRLAKDHKRVLTGVPPKWARPWSRHLMHRVNALIPPDECLDHLWYPGRGEPLAYSKLQPDWQFCDITKCFPSLSMNRVMQRLRRLAHHQDRGITGAVEDFFARTGTDLSRGLPEGSALSFALANVYLLHIDRQFRQQALRAGDNWATSDLPRLHNVLLDHGLKCQVRTTFTKSHLRLYGAVETAPGLEVCSSPSRENYREG